MTRVHRTTSRVLPLLALVATVLPASLSTEVQASPVRPQNVTAIQPTRVLDTREGLGAPSAGPIGPGSAPLSVAIPAAASAGASSVVLNLTATDAAGDGWVKAWPCGEPVPATSNLNFTPGRSVANAVIIKLPAGGVCLATSASVHLIADVAGWYTGTQDFSGSTPNRLVDTRTTGDPLQPGQERRLKVAGTPGIANNATMVALNVTIDRPSNAGWVVAYPCGQPTDASTVNFQAGEIVANLTVVGLSGGDVCFRSLGAVQLVVDSYGWSAGAGKLRVASPSRLIDTRETAQWPAGDAEALSTVQLQVAGRGGVPSDADAALLTVTVTGPSSDGFVTVWPCDQPFPVASTINTWANSLRSNLSFVKLSASDGKACLQYRSSNGSPTDLVVDAVGWVTGGPSRTIAPGIGTFVPAPVPNPPAPPSGPSLPPGTVPPAGGSLSPNGAVQWVENFSSANGMNRLAQEVHTDGNWPQKTFGGDHDHNCGGPTTIRPLVEDHTLATHFWHCAPGSDPAKGHFMTGMNTEGYVIIAFSPKDPTTGRAMIFPATATQICWDQNLTDLGGRKWTQLAIVSDDTYLSHNPTSGAPKLAYRNPDFSEVAGETSLDIGPDGFLFNNLRNSVEFFKGSTGTVLDELGLPGVTDKAARYETCVRDNGNGTVTRTQSRPGAVSVVTGPGSFPAGPRVFILEDDSYNSMKDYDGPIPLSSDPYTWHWDNIEISGG